MDITTPVEVAKIEDLEIGQSYIYLIERKETGQKYVGKSLRYNTPGCDRQKQHKSAAFSDRGRKLSPHLYASFRKHATRETLWDHFSFRIIEVLPVGSTGDDTSLREIDWIARLNTFRDRRHFNLTEGGDGLTSEAQKARYKKLREKKGLTDGETKICNCTTCPQRGQIQPIENFGVSSRTYDKHAHYCKVCQLQKDRAYNEKNREAIQAKNKVYREKNREAIKARSKVYREKNSETIKAKKKVYREQNLDNLLIKSKTYREHNRQKISDGKKRCYQKRKAHYIGKAAAYYKKNKKKRIEQICKLQKTPLGRAKNNLARVKCVIRKREKEGRPVSTRMLATLKKHKATVERLTEIKNRDILEDEVMEHLQFMYY